MTVIAAEVDGKDVVIGFDGRALGGITPDRDNAIKAAPLNELWAVSYMGSTGFLSLMARELWGPHYAGGAQGVLDGIVAAGRDACRPDLLGDCAIDAVDSAICRHRGGMLQYAANDCVILAGHAKTGPTIVTWAAADQFERKAVEEAYGRVHFMATPWGVGPCAQLVLATGAFEERFAPVLESLARFSNGCVNVNMGVMRHSGGWEVEGRGQQLANTRSNNAPFSYLCEHRKANASR